MKIVPRAPFRSSRAHKWTLSDTYDEGRMWLGWLVRFRWVAVLGQAVTLSFSIGVLDSAVVVVPTLFGLMLLEVVANLYTQQRLLGRGHIGQNVLLTQLLLDIGVLTIFFLAAGGHTNPFVMLYLIHVAMAALMMRAPYALAATGVVLACNGVIHALHLPLHPEAHTIEANTLMIAGQMVAFTVTVLSIVFFVFGMSDTLRHQKRTLAMARERSERVDRLRSLGTLAAGAAHELNTPLSTMGLRLRRIERRHHDEPTEKDVTAITRQLERCTTIVQQLLVGAGDPSAVGMERAPLAQLVKAAIGLWEKGSTLEAHVETSEDAPDVEVPHVAFTQAFINLLENSRQAQEEGDVFEPLSIQVRREGDQAVVLLHDLGPGLPDEPERIGEPFFTTKDTGTGLGVFVARAVADGSGGGLSYSRTEHTTITRWWFPAVGRG